MELKIEKLIYGGDALARVRDEASGRSKAIFVPFAVPGETVDASVSEHKKGFSRGTLQHVVHPSPARVEPPCPYFYRCGGCHYQHIRYEDQLAAKAAILEETLARTAKLTLSNSVQTHASSPWNYRNRTRLKIAHAPQFAVGYYRFGSHALLPVEQCPISSPLINRALAAVWQLGRDGQVDSSIRELQFFANHDDSRVLVEFYTTPEADSAVLERTAEALRTAVPEIAGVAVFEGAPADDAEDQRAPLARSKASTSLAAGGPALTYRAAGHDFRVSAGSFFQTNRFLLDEMARLVTHARSGELAIDLYAGAGLFTVPLSGAFGKVIAVEISPYSSSDLKANAGANVTTIHATTEQFLFSGNRRYAPDLVVVDPPRAGLGEKTARLLGKLPAHRITYVSCDPATLSRDVRVLIESGFQVEEIHLLDLFPQTFHIETILQLVR